MKFKQLERSDLPKTRSSGNSLHILCHYKNEERYICDIHFGNDSLCWLEDNDGEPVEISDIKIVVKEPITAKVSN